jgi:predicted LPLAT superfamily acyltransferase
VSSGENADGHWSKLAERGSVLGLRTVFFCYRILGQSAARLLLYPIVTYFFITGSKARAASLDFLRRVNQINRLRGSDLPEPGWRDSFRHMLAFGQSGLDKLAAWTGDLDCSRLDFPMRDELERLCESGRGAVLIGSHLGNLEMSRALAVNERQRKINAVLYTKHALRFNAMLNEANANFGVNFIQISQLGPETAILLKEKVDQGELVVIVGDRTPPGESGSTRVSLVDFLGAPAPFAQGPFILASLLECPVYLFFCLRQGGQTGKTFRVHLERFAERIELPRRQRKERLQGYMQQYASRLEHFCLSAPLQWFNFYDFWRQEAAAHQDKD